MTVHRKFDETEIKRILRAAFKHKDKRAAASISLLLMLSVPLYVQESLHWKNFAVVRGTTSIAITGRFFRLDAQLSSAPARHLMNLRTISTDSRVFDKPNLDSPNLRDLVNDILLQADVLGCSHSDLVRWSRRQTDDYRRYLSANSRF
jgi:hypothetical protein